MLQVNLTQELVDALLALPKEVAGLKAHLNEVLEENRNLRLGVQHYTREEVCSLLKVSKSTLEKWDREGLFRAMKISGKWLYSGQMIAEFSRYHQLNKSNRNEVELDGRPANVRPRHNNPKAA